MPATSPDAIARKRERDRTAHAARQKKYRNNNVEYADNEQRRNQRRHLPSWRLDPERYMLLAYDGEALQDNERYNELGTYNPTLGDSIMASHTHRITLSAALSFFRSLARQQHARDGKRIRLLGYATHYDVDQWIRHEPKLTDDEKIELASHRKRAYGVVRTPGFSMETELPSLGIRAYFGRKEWRVDWLREDGSTRQRIDAMDCFSLFNASFIVACERFLYTVDPESPLLADLDMIRRGKVARGSWAAHDMTPDDVIAYNQAELHWLYHLGSVVVELCKSLGLAPRSIASPAHISRALMHKYGLSSHVKPRDYDSIEYQEGDWMTACRGAFYGGCIEQAVQGEVAEYWAYDLISAYPAEIQSLPCLAHGTPRKLAKKELRAIAACGVYRVSWHWQGKGAKPNLGPLPVRNDHGEIYRPLNGRGWYHSPEIMEIATDSDYKVTIHEGWIWESNCAHACPFQEMVNEVFSLRATYKEQRDPREYILKLALNSLYGILAQTAGQYRTIDEDGNTTGYHTPKFSNLFGAGLITSGVRAKLYRTTRENEGTCIAWATDCVFSVTPLKLATGSGLGDWEVKREHGPALFVAPGIRITPDPKDNYMRGMSRDSDTNLWELAREAFAARPGWQSFDTIERRYLDINHSISIINGERQIVEPSRVFATMTRTQVCDILVMATKRDSQKPEQREGYIYYPPHSQGPTKMHPYKRPMDKGSAIVEWRPPFVE